MYIEELIPGVNLETGNIEFKEILKEGKKPGESGGYFEIGWLKELAAFANTTGGAMFVGVKNDTHEVNPLDHEAFDKTVQLINRQTKQHAEPEIPYRITPIAVPGYTPARYVMRIDVKRSSYAPITVKFKDTGTIYVRKFGLTSVATSEEIRNLVLDSENIHFDAAFTQTQYRKQDFSLFEAYFKKANGREISEKELFSIGFISEDGKLSKGAMLFQDGFESDKTLVVCSEYKGISKGDNATYATKSIKANLLREYEDIIDFIGERSADGYIKVFGGQEKLISFPPRSLQEAIINALAHRNYFMDGSQIEINRFADRLEIVSPGSLPGLRQLNEETNLSSIPPIRRNEVICAAFSLLKLMEKRGSGFDKIEQDYAPYGEKFAPMASSSSDFFALTLPDLAFKEGLISKNQSPAIYPDVELSGKKDLAILSYCYPKPRSAAEIAKQLGITPSSYFRQKVLERLCQSQHLIKIEKGPTTLYSTNRERVHLAYF